MRAEVAHSSDLSCVAQLRPEGTPSSKGLVLASYAISMLVTSLDALTYYPLSLCMIFLRLASGAVSLSARKIAQHVIRVLVSSTLILDHYLLCCHGSQCR